MKRTLLVLLSCGAIFMCSGQSDPNAMPNTYAQKLVNEEMTKHPDVLILAMHAKSASDPKYPIVAWAGPTGGKVRIGKQADEDDMRVIDTGKENLEINSTGDRFEVELALEDTSKKTIGALGIVFNYKPGDNKAAFKRKAEEIRDELRTQIPSAEKLSEAQ